MIRSHPGQAADIDWDEVFRLYEPEIRAAVRSWVGFQADAVDDVVQETLAEVYVRRFTYDPAFPLGPWLKEIGRNVAKRRWRVQPSFTTVGLHVIDATARLAHHGAGSDEHVAQLADRGLLQVAMQAVPARNRRVYWLRVVERVPADVVAAEEGMTPAAVRQQVKRTTTTARAAIVALKGDRPTWSLAPVLGALGARVRARWARLAGAGWPDAAVTCAVPVVVAGMAVVSSIWPLPNPMPRPAPDARAGAADQAPAVVPPAPVVTGPSPAPAGQPPAARPPAPPAPAVPAVPAEATTDAVVRTSVTTETPAGTTEMIVDVAEIECDKGVVNPLLCTLTPD